MYRSLVIACVVVVATFSRAHAESIPTVTFRRDSCLVACPAADSVFYIRGITMAGQLVVGGDVVLDFYSMPGMVIPPEPPGSPYQVSGPAVVARTDASGSVYFPLALGGLSGSNRVRMYVNGYYLGPGPVLAAFDQNGDLMVDDLDLALIDTKVGTSDATADFDCDRAVTITDLVIANTHRRHAHWQTVGVGDEPSIAFGVHAAPNPTRGPVEFVLRAPGAGRARIAIFDVSGRRLATVLDREVEPGVHRIPWTGRDAAGRSLPAGLYPYRVTLGSLATRGALIVTR